MVGISEPRAGYSIWEMQIESSGVRVASAVKPDDNRHFGAWFIYFSRQAAIFYLAASGREKTKAKYGLTVELMA